MREPPGRWTRTGTSDRRSCRHRKTTTAAGVLVVVAMALTACSTGSDPNTQSASSLRHSLATSTTTPAGPTTTTTPAQSAVITAWEAAEQTLYAYIDQPPAPLRADLVAGETTADLFPKLANYYVDPSLQSTGLYLVKLKMALVNGPTSYNLGTPVVTALTASTATVSACTNDTGTTTATGQPARTALGGGTSGARGTSNLVLVGGSWKIASGQFTGVAKC